MFAHAMTEMNNIVEGFSNLALDRQKELYSQRMAICKGCQQFDAKLYRCKSCGCFLPAKTRVERELCPEGKW
jgi:hypothetical protein